MFLLLYFTHIAAAPFSGSWKYSVELNKGSYRMEWTVPDENDRLQIRITAKTHGWVGFGLSPRGGMAGADIVIAGVNDSTGEGYVYDYELIEATQIGAYTSVTLERSIKTCDPQDLDITVTIPEDSDTLYVCKLFEIPDHVRAIKHHMIRAEYLIDQHEFVHHVSFFHCPYRIDVENNTQRLCGSGTGIKYLSWNRSPMRACTLRYSGGWSVGQEVFFDFPQDTGYPVGGDEEGQFMLEVHYDNSGLRKEIPRDNSGFRMWLTPTPRKMDYSILTIGLPVNSHSVLIPPGQGEFTMHSFCNGECMERLPTKGINIHSCFLHQHLAGKAMRLRHIRDGVEQAPLFQDMNYDFNYQNGHVLSNTVKVFPNDTFLFDCVFQTRDRTTVTTAGLSSQDEMCLAFVGYYPRVEQLVSCQSGPESRAYTEALAEIDGNFTLKHRATVQMSVESIDFGRAPDGVMQTPAASMFEEHLRNGKQKLVCVSSKIGNNRLQKVFRNQEIPLPSKENEYKRPNEC